MAGATQSEFPSHVPSMKGRAFLIESEELMKALEPYPEIGMRSSRAEIAQNDEPAPLFLSGSSCQQQEQMMSQFRFPDVCANSVQRVSDSRAEFSMNGNSNAGDLTWCPSFEGLPGTSNNSQQQYMDVGLQSMPVTQMGWASSPTDFSFQNQQPLGITEIFEQIQANLQRKQQMESMQLQLAMARFFLWSHSNLLQMSTSTTTKTSHYNFERMHEEAVNKSLVKNESESYISGPSKGVTFYMLHPNELRNDHPIWHYFYLCTLIFAAFVSLFVGPVIFGMLAAIGGVGTPLALSFVGGGIGLLLGLVFGVVFSVVCIVALVRALGLAAQWVLDSLWFGGSDLMLITKEQILYLINNQD